MLGHSLMLVNEGLPSTLSPRQDPMVSQDDRRILGMASIRERRHPRRLIYKLDAAALASRSSLSRIPMPAPAFCRSSACSPTDVSSSPRAQCYRNLPPLEAGGHRIGGFFTLPLPRMKIPFWRRNPTARGCR